MLKCSVPCWFGVLVLQVFCGEALNLSFDKPDSLKSLQIEGSVSIDATKNRKGGAGGSLKVEPGAVVTLKLRKKNGCGEVEMWVFEDGSKASEPKKRGSGAMWGLLQENGPLLVVGGVYAPYLAGDKTYASSEFGLGKNERPWWKVQYLALKRIPGRHRWNFIFDTSKGLRILYDGKDINERRQVFNWSRTHLRGFSGVIFFGDKTDSGQILWIDDLKVSLGREVEAEPLWPPPPPKGFSPLEPFAEFDPTPYGRWKNGPGRSPDYFPMAVWLQAPRNAKRYRSAGFNLYVDLWKGPTEEQLSTLKGAGMPVICPRTRPD